MPRKKSTPAVSAPAPAADPIGSIHYPAKRRHIPPAGLEAQGQIADAPIRRYQYNPHLPPVLRIADEARAADKLPELLQTSLHRSLTPEEAGILAAVMPAPPRQSTEQPTDTPIADRLQRFEQKLDQICQAIAMLQERIASL